MKRAHGDAGQAQSSPAAAASVMVADVYQCVPSIDCWKKIEDVEVVPDVTWNMTAVAPLRLTLA